MGRTFSMFGRIQKCIQPFTVNIGGKETFREAKTQIEDNIKIDLREVDCDAGDWIGLAQDRDQLWVMLG